ncbi:hypothetical protein RclHR1_32130001 [Rhizophagus clarus]|uniref:Uncharacterized protein n=1 Tax=Rhizophagus clarus TaxID=94130 RepID=A0A2Z6RBM3_9GLOM|nr:hypothetical protein RclHR1_32130001 [Rhizophagus clarus]
MKHLPERHIVGLTPSDLEIVKSSALHSICFYRNYLFLEKTKDPKVTFNCTVLISYLEINDQHEYICNINALYDNNQTEHFDNTEDVIIKTLDMEFLSIKDDNTEYFDINIINSEEFIVKPLGMKFLFIKDDNDNLIIFKDEEREIDGKVIMAIPDEDIFHIHYKGIRIYFNSYVIVDMEYKEIIKSIIGFLSFYYQK